MSSRPPGCKEGDRNGLRVRECLSLRLWSSLYVSRNSKSHPTLRNLHTRMLKKKILLRLYKDPILSLATKNKQTSVRSRRMMLDMPLASRTARRPTYSRRIGRKKSGRWDWPAIRIQRKALRGACIFDPIWKCSLISGGTLQQRRKPSYCAAWQARKKRKPGFFVVQIRISIV